MKNQFLYLLFAIVLLYACEPTTNSTTTQTETPNILWLVCEDQSPMFFPFYGDETADLPNLERLAKEGVVYDNMFASVPVCAPARSSIITGMYPSTLGTHNMRVFNAYKKENEASIGIPSYSPKFPEGVQPFTKYLREKGYYCTNNAKEDYNFKPIEGMWDESSNKATWKNKKEGQPFFAVFNFNVTHESGIWRNGKKKLLVKKENVKRPPYFPNDDVIDHDLAVNYSNLIRMDEKVGVLLEELEDSGMLEKTIIFFYSDHGGPFPRHKRSLYDSGTKVPMVIRFPNQKNKGTRNDDLLSFLDFAPTILSLAHIKVPAVIQGRSFLGKYAASQKREYIFATSDRYDEVYDRKRSVRSKQYKYIRNFFPELPYAIPVSYRLQMPMMQRLIEMDSNNELTGVEKLWMAKQKPKEEFYDLQKDPFELNNLATDPAYVEKVKTFSNVLDNWMLETNDLGEVDEKELVKRWN